MDEAGYGPNLGPLLIVLTRWQTPGIPHECDFYRLLKKSVAADGTANGSKLHLADSKRVNSGKNGFQTLELSALSLLHCLGMDTGSFQMLRSQLTHLTGNHSFASNSPAPWYGEDLFLPVAASPQQIAQHSRQFQKCMEKARLQLTAVHAEFVEEERFNHLVDANGDNKGLTLSRLAFRLLRCAWSPEEPHPVFIVGDKHGGRNRYDDLLAEVLDQEMIFRLEEGQQLSRYRIRQSELRFQVGGECHLPVACASIIAKYLRELAMILFNRYWSTHCPDVKPTLGYPNDARRFREQVDGKRNELRITDRIFWRTK